MSPARITLTLEQRIMKYSRIGTVPDHRPELGHCIEWDGSHNGQAGYAEIRLSAPNRKLYVHRVVYALRHPDENIDGLVVDHRCHNTGCIRASHLRAITQRRNLENRRGATRASRTGARNVYPLRGRFVVRVTKDGKQHAGGGYETIEAAERAAIALRTKLGMTS